MCVSAQLFHQILTYTDSESTQTTSGLIPMGINAYFGTPNLLTYHVKQISTARTPFTLNTAQLRAHMAYFCSTPMG